MGVFSGRKGLYSIFSGGGRYSVLKIIIVEDETIIRNGLVKHISWESLGINEIKVAANTQEALSICESYVPDIVVSDTIHQSGSGFRGKLYP